MEQQKDYTEAFKYLYQLQDSGETNMFGAPRYLEDMGYSRGESGEIFNSWTQSWNEEDFEEATS